VAPFEKRLFGHRQVTDAYLLGLAVHKKGRLVTLDETVAALLVGQNLEQQSAVVTL
jgi:predicted nucleic acid-binding protein